MNIRAKQNVGFEGLYRIIVRSPDLGVRKVLEFPNLILDNGLNGIGVQSSQGTSWMTTAALGTGTAAPAAGDTSLTNPVSTTTNASPSVTTGHVSTGTPYNWAIFRKEFAQGDATGNWTEVGIGRTATDLWSRALIVDNTNTPVTLTIVASDIVTIEYELRVFPKITDVTGTVSIGGVTHDYIIRPAGFSAYSEHDVSTYVSGNLMGNFGFITPYDGNIGSYTGTPSGAAASGPLTMTVAAYSNNSYTKEATWNLAIDQGNLANKIRSVSYYMAWPPILYQCQFDPVIDKDNTKTLSLTFKLVWARR
jgi:hypothetical protein